MKTLVRQSFARAGYSLLLRSVVPLYRLRLLWRGRREPLYATAIGERFGRYREPLAPGALWMHAVSLGETRAMAPLVDALRAARPGLRFVFTHGTATGRAAAASRFGQISVSISTPAIGCALRRKRRTAPGVSNGSQTWRSPS